MTTSDLKARLAKAVDFLKSELTQIRTGRATPALVEGVVVDAYGTKMTIKEVASISVLDSQNLTISPWDKGLVKEISRAINDSDLKINPIVDGDHLRLPIPALTEDRRKDFVKTISAKVEETKTSIRNIRQEAMKDIDNDFAAKLFGEDDKFAKKEEVEKIVKEVSTQADAVGDAKKEDILKI